MYKIIRFLMDALFPPQCVPCGKKLPSTSSFLTVCDTCFARIPLRTGFTCSMCGARQPTLINTCHKNAPIVASATDYTNKEAQLLIRALKYDSLQTAHIPLVALLLSFIASRPEFSEHNGFLLIPIPLHKKKMRKRGFNQSALIARALSEALPEKFSYCDDALFRIINTPSQTTQKTHAERNNNMNDAFVVRVGAPIKGKIVFLVDDVCTSGATIREATRIIKLAGARSVFGLVVAKA